MDDEATKEKLNEAREKQVNSQCRSLLSDRGRRLRANRGLLPVSRRLASGSRTKGWRK